MIIALIQGMQPESTNQTKEQIKILQQESFHDLNVLRDRSLSEWFPPFFKTWMELNLNY